jgi:predicted RNA binding protein YcfA (HicA-like mRNA interferase family)
MTGKQLLRWLKSHGFLVVGQNGSHVKITCGASNCGKCTTVVPVHAGEDLGKGLLAAIKRQLRCYPKGKKG